MLPGKFWRLMEGGLVGSNECISHQFRSLKVASCFLSTPDMFIALIKLGDIAARSLFVLVVLYSLHARASGQFGLVLTLIGLFGFLSGFERYVDLQRILIGKAVSEVDRLIFSVLRFFGVNYVIWLPVLFILLYGWADLSIFSVCLCLLIAIGEHLANEFYRVALITNRHRSVLLVGLVKNLVLCVVVAGSILTKIWLFDLNQVLEFWASMSLLGLSISVFIFVRVSVPREKFVQREFVAVSDQYKRSAIHFAVGLVAVMSLQVDRLVAGGVLSFEDSGVYFRHIFLALSAYQVLGIISFNRVMPKIYSSIRADDLSTARMIIRRERLIYIALTGLLMIFVLLTALPPVSNLPMVRDSVQSYLILLLFAYLIRGLADYNALVLNALYLEGYVLRALTISVGLSMIISIVLTMQLGLPGLLLAVFIGAAIYLFITSFFSARALKLREDAL